MIVSSNLRKRSSRPEDEVGAHIPGEGISTNTFVKDIWSEVPISILCHSFLSSPWYTNCLQLLWRLVLLLVYLKSPQPQRVTRRGTYPFVDPLSNYQTPPNPYNVDGSFIDWSTYKANGVNLGSWLEKERTHDPIWWVDVGGDNATDEWVSDWTLAR